MPYCPKCGVELEESLKRCPLCKSPVSDLAEPKADHAGVFPESSYDPEIFEGLTKAERKKVAIEVLSVSFLIALAVTLLINLAVNRAITWSLYPASSIVFLWIMISSLITFEGKPLLIYAIIGPSLIAYVFCLDLIDWQLSWFLDVGLPIALAFEFAVSLTTLFATLLRRKGMNLVGLILLGIDFLCLCIEAVLTRRFTGKISFGWSVVVSVALVPVSVFLFYLHYRITKQASLRKLFRL
jgi:hypothetical protein